MYRALPALPTKPSSLNRPVPRAFWPPVSSGFSTECATHRVPYRHTDQGRCCQLCCPHRVRRRPLPASAPNGPAHRATIPAVNVPARLSAARYCAVPSRPVQPWPPAIFRPSRFGLPAKSSCLSRHAILSWAPCCCTCWVDGFMVLAVWAADRAWPHPCEHGIAPSRGRLVSDWGRLQGTAKDEQPALLGLSSR